MKQSGVRVIGLTGGIASGKSTVARFFSERGIPVIDADQLARDVVLPGSPAIGRIVALFGVRVLREDGSLDRALVRELVFADLDKRKQLEEILHPEIRRLAETSIKAASDSGSTTVIYMAPLLIEAGAIDRVDDVWLVSLLPEVQLQRLMARDHIPRAAAERMIGSQMPLAEKERFATQIINNNGTWQETSQQLELLWKKEFGTQS